MNRRLILLAIVILIWTTVACSLGSVIDRGTLTGTPVATAGGAQVDPTSTGTPAAPQPTGTPSTPAGDTPDQTEIPVQQRMAALEEVAEYLNDLSGMDRAADGQAIAEYLSARPEFKAAGVSSDGTVWAEFSDGRLLAVFNNLAVDGEAISGRTLPGPVVHAVAGPPLRAAAYRAQETAVELPRSDQARVLVALGNAYEYYDAGPAIGSLLARANYHSASGAEATVAGLKQVSGDGVFYFNTHGGLLQTHDREPAYALVTTTPINAYNETLLQVDIKAGRVVYTVAPHNRNPAYDSDRDPPGRRSLWEYHYGITADFVREYMVFAEHSFVYVRACSSGHADMRNAFLEKGAGAYVGWSQSVKSDGAYRATMFLFDRLLGANQVAPVEQPKQRPFDLEAVYVNMRERGLHVVGGAELNVWSRTGASIALVPSIAYMQVLEQSDELFLFGLFGSEQGEVTISGAAAPVRRWDKDIVVVGLTSQGAGSAGDVIVKVRDHESNVVPLTEWRGEIRYTFDSTLPVPGLKTEVVVQAHFRADVHPYREKPGLSPVERQDVHLALAGDSGAQWQMSGHVSKNGATFSLEGSGILPLYKVQPDDNFGHFDMIGTLEPQGILQGKPPRIVALDFHVHTAADPSEGKLTITYPSGKQEAGYPIPQTDALYDLTMQLEQDFSVKADQIQSNTILGAETVGSGTLQWDPLQARHAPDLNDLPLARAPLFVW